MNPSLPLPLTQALWYRYQNVASLEERLRTGFEQVMEKEVAWLPASDKAHVVQIAEKVALTLVDKA